jgi:hypothetical protein
LKGFDKLSKMKGFSRRRSRAMGVVYVAHTSGSGFKCRKKYKNKGVKASWSMNRASGFSASIAGMADKGLVWVSTNCVVCEKCLPMISRKALHCWGLGSKTM